MLIYIADDEENIRNLVRAFLKNEGYEVEVFESGDLLFEAFGKKECDLVILDIMMSGNSGLVICAKLRAISDVPIIMLTAKDTEEDYVSGLALGSDDYFTKPFSPVKLTMRVKAMLRRIEMQRPSTNNEITFSDIKILPDKLTAYCNNEALSLTKTEFNLLSYLLENKDKAISRDELLTTIWGYENVVESRATDDTVKRLRKKLDKAGSVISIKTVWGYGFKVGVKGEEV
ncbi:MAG: response regulator transcription factor [Defluviitaleaceae bacterium]|nr:response regulator transcription factor [Defluviitaleaceae bacterium]